MTTATAAPPVVLMTAEEYAALPDDGRRTELVRGRIVEMPLTNFRHGVICNRVGRLLGNHAEDRKLGWVVSNDAGVVTERDPDTTRGPDVAFFSYTRVPKDQPPDGYPAVPPELVVEVKSPSDRWKAVNAKQAEYLAAGVLAVWVLDPETAVAVVYAPDDAPRRLAGDEELTLPGVLPDFRVAVRQLFE